MTVTQKTHTQSARLAIVAIVLTVLCLMPTIAQAADAQNAIIDGAINPILIPIAVILTVANSIVVSLLTFSTQAVGKILEMPVITNLEVLKFAWGIVRDFCNMLFIVILIIMAFGTILGTTFTWFSQYDWRKLLVSFLIAAVLINFSLPLSQLVVNLSASVTGIFLSAIGNFSVRMGDVLKPTALLGSTVYDQGALQQGKEVPVSSFGDTAVKVGCTIAPILAAPGLGALAEVAGFKLGDKCVSATKVVTQAASTISMTNGQIIRLFFNTFLGAFMVINMVIVFVFAFLRIPFLWFLIALSPLALMLNILPQTRKFAKQWATEFVSWNLFLPIFLFVLTFGMFFLSSAGIVTRGLSANLNEGFVNTVSAPLELVLYYIMAAIILIGGTALALKAGRGIGGEAGEQFGKMHAWTTSYRPAWYTGTKQAVEARGQQFKKEGLPGAGRFLYGGEAAVERAKGRVSRFLGVKGQTQYEQLQKGIADQKTSLSGRLKTISDKAGRQSLLEQLKNVGTVEQQIAARQLLQEQFQGALNARELLETYQLMGGDQNAEAIDFASKLAFKDMAAADRQDWYSKVKSVDVLRKLAEVMRDEGDFKKGPLTTRTRALQDAAKLFKTLEDQKKFLKEAEKKDVVAAHKTRYAMGLVKDDAGAVIGETDIRAQEELERKVTALNEDAIKDIHEDDLDLPEVGSGIARKYTKNVKAAENVLTSLTSAKDQKKAIKHRGLQKRGIDIQIQELGAQITALQPKVDAKDESAKRRQRKLQDKRNEYQDMYNKIP